MSRLVRLFLLGCVAVTYAYLLWHSREPLRLNIGDPGADANVLSSVNYVKNYGFLATSFTGIRDIGPLTADSYRYIHYPPLSEIIYGAVGRYLGASDIATFRLFAIGFSALAMWLLFCYARRMYSDAVALIATMLFTTSFLWLQYADSVHQAPVMQASGFLALWGLVRAIETRQRRHYAAMMLGTFACFLASYDYWLFLPAGVLFTVWVKSGNPFARTNRHFVALCALGCCLGIVAKCLAVIGAVGWNELLADLHLQFLERSTSTHDRKLTSGGIPTMFRRITLVFTPFAWVAASIHLWRALRAPTVSAALKTTAIWMLVVALAFLYVFARLAASQMLASQVLLPFYAIGSALVIDRWLGKPPTFRNLALGWLVLAPLWSFYFMVTHSRSWLDRDDVAKVNAYMANNDHNDFMMSNVLSDGHIQVSFQRRYWAALDSGDTSEALRQILRVLEMTGTDHLHAAIFTTPESRFIDKSLRPLALPRRLWSVTGWPHLYRGKVNSIIRGYDAAVLDNLNTVGATKVMSLSNFDLYRIDRAALLGVAGRDVATVARIDFGNLTSSRHTLLGWGKPLLTKQGIGASQIKGYSPCPLRRAGNENACKTVRTKLGLRMKVQAYAPRAQLLIRVERSCDLQLTLSYATPSYVAVSVGDFTAKPSAPSTTATFLVPQRSVNAGLVVVTLENQLASMARDVEVATLEIAPRCDAP